MIGYNRRVLAKSRYLPARVVAPAINRHRVSKNAAAVVARLREAGFAAYLVGGCVRDLLLGHAPKDFDVATDARPEAICELFPRARLIGRRFRIVHVRMRGETIEVSTFRGAVDADRADAEPSASMRVEDAAARVSANGVILRDNAYGTLDGDALRRDFTVNALYYDPGENVLLDYCDGMADIAAGTLRLIGEPATRFREDPVRVLRAVRFAAKLELKVDEATAAAIAPSSDLLAAVPPARLFDEFCKLFLCGHGARAFELVEHFGLADALLSPAASGSALFRRALANTDQRIRAHKPVTPGFLLAALLWPDYCQRIRGAAAARRAERQQIMEQAGRDSFTLLRQRVTPPRRHAYFARDIWELQPRLARRRDDDIEALLAQRRFRAAYDFLLLRAEAGEVPAALGQWWTQAQTPGADRPAAIESDTAVDQYAPDATAGEEQPAPSSAGERAPKRRRRRRRGRNRSRSRQPGSARGTPSHEESRQPGSARGYPSHEESRQHRSG